MGKTAHGSNQDKKIYYECSMTVTQEYNKAILKGRKNHIAYQQVGDRQLWKVYKDAATKVSGKIMAAETPITRGQFKTLLASIKSELDRLDNKVLHLINRNINKSVKIGVKDSVDRIKIYKDYIPAVYVIKPTSSVLNSIYHDAVRALFRRPLDGIALSDRVWDIHVASLTKIRRIIGTGFLYGEPQYKIAQQVRKMLLISDSDMRKKVWKEFFKRYPPGRGVYKSAYQNTRRVMRTEINNAYKLAQSEYAKSRAWILGVKWNRVAGAEDCPECDDYDTQDLYGLGSGVYPGGEIPTSHPNCLCFLTEVFNETIRVSIASARVVV